MKNNAGFTLMELMIVIAIIGIMSSIAVPNMIAWRNNMQFNSSLRMIKSAINGTRMDAIKSNMPSRLDFTDGGASFDTVKWDLAADAWSTAETHQLPPGVVLVNSSFSSDVLRFTSRGVPDSTIGFGGTLTIENTSGDLCQQILVSSTGRARIANCP